MPAMVPLRLRKVHLAGTADSSKTFSCEDTWQDQAFRQNNGLKAGCMVSKKHGLQHPAACSARQSAGSRTQGQGARARRGRAPGSGARALVLDVDHPLRAVRGAQHAWRAARVVEAGRLLPQDSC